MLVVPLQAVPAQQVSVTLENQVCQIVITQQQSGLYMSLYVNNVLIIGGVLCENHNRIVRSVYLGFSGDFVFDDTQGVTDPIYTGLGDRFQLLYLTEADVTAARARA